MFLGRTIQDILEHIEGDTEIIAVCDGGWPVTPIPDHPRVRLIYFGTPIGQRAATNQAARLSKAKYLMKCDAHCSFDQGFDVNMMKEMKDDWTMIPVMKNLHAFDWLCKNGHRRYQGPSGPCKDCGELTAMDVVWRAKPSPNSRSYFFDQDLHFQYWKEFEKRQEGEIAETLSIQGSCWMVTRQKYWELDLCDESFGSWGQQGVEVSVKTWLSGGRVVVNKNTWYAHMFRTQGKDFGFPYPLSQSQVDHARARSKELFLKDKWPKAIHPFSWLIEKFSPVPGWDKPSKGLVHYTDNACDEKILEAVRNQTKKSCNGHELVSVSLKAIELGRNIVLAHDRGILTMFRQILAGLEACHSKIIFLAEHDVLLHPSHLAFIPPRADTFYYNQNVWKVEHGTGRALFYLANQTSGLCAYRELLIEHYRKRVEQVEKHGFSRRNGFEPGTRKLRHGGFDDSPYESWMSPFPNIDIRHGDNLTPTRWSQKQFRNKKYCQGWKMGDLESIPGWDNQELRAILGVK